MGRAISVLCLLFVLVAASCGGSDDDENGGFEPVLAQIQGLKGKERERKLLELAREEGGSLSFYTSMTPSREEAITDAFGEAYDVAVSVYRADSKTIAQRVTEEADAGFHGADVVEMNGLRMVNLNDAGLLVPYRSEYQRRLVRGAVQDGWTVDSLNTLVVSWNTELVAEGTQPRSWEDLADPRWEGKLALEIDDVDWYKTLRQHWVEQEGKTEEQADELFGAMARGASIVDGHSLMGQLMAAGEFDVGVNFREIVSNLARDGAPLAWQPVVEPVISRPTGAGLVEGTQHPAAALLFVDWLLSEGQKVLAEAGVDPARTDLAAVPVAKQLVVDPVSLAAEQDEWTERYERLAGLGKKVEGER